MLSVLSLIVKEWQIRKDLKVVLKWISWNRKYEAWIKSQEWKNRIINKSFDDIKVDIIRPKLITWLGLVIMSLLLSFFWDTSSNKRVIDDRIVKDNWKSMIKKNLTFWIWSKKYLEILKKIAKKTQNFNQ